MTIVHYMINQHLAAAFATGILLHTTLLKNIELDVYILQFLAAAVEAVITLTAAHVWLRNLTLAKAIQSSAAEACLVVLGLFTSMTIYRLLFHRLRKFPGPIGARVSRFYNLYLSAKNVQYHVEIEKLHKQYGDFIRTGKAMLSRAGELADESCRTSGVVRRTKVGYTSHLKPAIRVPEDHVVQPSLAQERTHAVVFLSRRQ
jgi:hypothetical protein